MRRPIFLAAAMLTACATVPPVEAGPTAALGRIAVVEGLRIRPLRVVEDSRCPINARCVWAGRMILHAEVTRGRRSAAYDLTLGDTIPYDGGRVGLVAAEPGRMAGSETDPAGYRFTFAFQR